MNALVLLISAILFVAALSLWVWTSKRLQAFQQYIEQQQAPEHVMDNITAINAGSIGMGGRFLKLEKNQQHMANKIEELQSQLRSNSPYEQAIKLVQKGSAAEEVMELCGISLNEAQLLIMMHGSNRAA
ncbi:MAG: DUF2802 domain-containing protein [Gammaproteobacteria bacterium]|nr:DUF2802 domain-containing protein [Gammaproteobacteria bacterium]